MVFSARMVGAVALALHASAVHVSKSEVLSTAWSLLRSSGMDVDDKTIGQVKSMIEGEIQHITDQKAIFHGDINKTVGLLRTLSARRTTENSTVANKALQLNTAVGEEKQALVDQESKIIVAANAVSNHALALRNLDAKKDVTDVLSLTDFACTVEDDCTSKMRTYVAKLHSDSAAMSARVNAGVAEFTRLKILSDKAEDASISAATDEKTARDVFSGKQVKSLVLIEKKEAALCLYGKSLSAVCVAVTSYDDTVNRVAISHNSSEDMWKSCKAVLCLLNGLASSEGTYDHTQLAQCQQGHDFFDEVGALELEKAEEEADTLKSDINCGTVDATFGTGDWTRSSSTPPLSTDYKFDTPAAAVSLETAPGSECHICLADHRVQDHQCVACLSGMRDAGDDASGDDTLCEQA